MNKEEFKNRLVLIEENIKNVNKEIQQSIANLNLLEGGRQECIYWLNNTKQVFSEQEQISEIEPVFIKTEEKIAEIEEEKKKYNF